VRSSTVSPTTSRSPTPGRTRDPVTAPARGEVWLADLNPTRGREQAGRRPVLVVSEDLFNQGPADLVIVLPITSTLRPIPSHLRISPPEGGLRVQSAVLCEAIRSISGDRLVSRWGRVSPGTMERVEDVLRILLRL
jgi:mRNA interferase MazF